MGSTVHAVAVPPALWPEPVRTAWRVPAELHRLAAGFVEPGVPTVALELTGMDWMPGCERLAAHGGEGLLGNARQGQQDPGRQTDVNDAH